MTREEMIADERYHVCGRCQWENIPFICHQCKWGEDTRKDLWNLKEDETKAKKCDDCVYSDISHWTQMPVTGKATPVLWCEKYRHFCSDITECEYYTEDSEDEE